MNTPALKTLKLQKFWKRIGFRFSCPASEEPVDVEQLIVDSIIAGRDEPVLVWALLTWLIHYADLVNIHRLLRMLNREIDFILGAVCDIALEHGADAKLKYVIRHCKPNQKPEILFNIMKQTTIATKNEFENSVPVFIKWGLYCSSISVKEDALFNRHYVLRNNYNLAIRAVFGANTKAEIFTFLSVVPKAYVTQMVKEIKLYYQPVYSEVENLLKNKLVEYEPVGRIKLVSLTKDARHFLKALPVM